MRSGWPHTGDGQGMQSADQRHVPFGPEVSWPNGYSDVEYRNGDYRYGPRAAQPPADGPGQHPYAAFDAAGYGDDGYSDPGYQGPSAQDAGIAGTRTVRGFVEAGHGQSGYAPDAGYAQSSYLSGYERPGYAGSSYAAGSDIEPGYPAGAAAPDAYRGDLYQQPWDYEQPLRYDGDEQAYPVRGGYQQDSGYRGQNDGAERYQPPAFDPAAYNGSDYSMPGVNGPGYDLAGIIGTSDFEAIGYDEPSYGRLSYDDPRYDQPRYDGPRFDETRLDNLWLDGDDVRREAEPIGYGNDGFGDTRNRSGYSSGYPSGGFPAFATDPGFATDGGRGTSADTRYDMKALAGPVSDHTRFDVPAFDETRLDNLRALSRFTGPQRAATAVLAPPATYQPRNWAEDTSLDHFADLDLTDEPVPAAFTRTLERPDRLEQDDDTATRRAVGRRRGRSGDRRQWMALGAIAVVAAGAIGGVLMKYVFSGPSGPAHQVVAPQTVDGFARSANLENQMHSATEAAKVEQASSGQASGVVSAVYEQGQVMGVGKQVFMFVGGKLAGADPASSVQNFEHSYKGAVAVPTGSLGGEAACTVTTANHESASMCVWFDNDTFGTVVSSTMTTAKLAATMNTIRPNLELLAK